MQFFNAFQRYSIVKQINWIVFISFNVPKGCVVRKIAPDWDKKQIRASLMVVIVAALVNTQHSDIVLQIWFALKFWVETLILSKQHVGSLSVQQTCNDWLLFSDVSWNRKELFSKVDLVKTLLNRRNSQTSSFCVRRNTTATFLFRELPYLLYCHCIIKGRTFDPTEASDGMFVTFLLRVWGQTNSSRRAPVVFALCLLAPRSWNFILSLRVIFFYMCCCNVVQWKPASYWTLFIANKNSTWRIVFVL